MTFLSCPTCATELASVLADNSAVVLGTAVIMHQVTIKCWACRKRHIESAVRWFPPKVRWQDRHKQ